MDHWEKIDIWSLITRISESAGTPADWKKRYLPNSDRFKIKITTPSIKSTSWSSPEPSISGHKSPRSRPSKSRKIRSSLLGFLGTKNGFWVLADRVETWFFLSRQIIGQIRGSLRKNRYRVTHHSDIWICRHTGRLKKTLLAKFGSVQNKNYNTLHQKY